MWINIRTGGALWLDFATDLGEGKTRYSNPEIVVLENLWHIGALLFCYQLIPKFEAGST